MKFELELSESDINVSFLSLDSGQPIIAKPPARGGVLKHVRCSDSSNSFHDIVYMHVEVHVYISLTLTLVNFG